MTPVAAITLTLNEQAKAFDDMAESAFKCGNLGFYSKYSECATRLRECADDLENGPVLGIQSLPVPPVVSTVPNDVFIHPEVRQ